MRRLLIVLSAFVIAAGSMGASQSGVRCYYDWSTARFNDNVITDSREFRNVVGACRSDRAESVPWDEYLRMARATSALPGIMRGSFQESWRRFIQMLERERDHLREVTASGVPDPSAERREVERARAFVLERLKPLDRALESERPAPGDSNVRALDLGPMLTDPVRQPDQLMLAPEFRSWVPQFLRERLSSTFRVTGRILQVEGEATIRRGDRSMRVSALLQRGNTWTLRPGDMFLVERGRVAVEWDGRRYDLTAGSINAIDAELDAQCMTRVTPRGDLILSAPMYLIKGTLLYMTTTAPVKPTCVMSTPHGKGSVRGTAFSATHVPAENGGSLSIAVTSGTVDFREARTNRTWTLSAGQSRTFQGPKRLEWLVSNLCNRPIDFKLHEMGEHAGQVAASWPATTISAGSSERIHVGRAAVGRQVCYGAATSDGRYWGIGLDGKHNCENCCWTTTDTAETRRVSLTCQ